MTGFGVGFTAAGATGVVVGTALTVDDVAGLWAELVPDPGNGLGPPATFEGDGTDAVATGEDEVPAAEVAADGAAGAVAAEGGAGRGTPGDWVPVTGGIGVGIDEAAPEGVIGLESA